MIRTAADLLDEFRKKETQMLDEQQIPHAPTIGRMYEGLTKEILGRTFPKILDLRVTSGFIRNKNGEMSKQIDCMLVSGEGENIPYTEESTYELQNVIAVVEVKKNLYSADLLSAYQNLFSVRELLKANHFSENDLFFDAYKSILKSEPYDEEVSAIPFWKRQIGLALFGDSVLPVRIVLGYHGFKDELNFRMAFGKLLENEVIQETGGALGLPNLIISDGYSLVKLNGMPYSSPILKGRKELYGEIIPEEIEKSNNEYPNDNLWHLLASYSSNSMIILLELIYTKIAYSNKIGDPNIEADLELEVLKPFLLAKAIEKNNKQGWYYEIVDIPEERLGKYPPSTRWQPVELNKAHYFLLMLLINKENEAAIPGQGIAQDDPDLLALFDDSELDLTETVEYLHHEGLLSIEIGKLRLLTKECKVAALPDGRLVAGDDSSGRFTNWLESYENV